MPAVVRFKSSSAVFSCPASWSFSDVPLATVNERFYSWLSKWSGPGQIIVLENEAVEPVVAEVLQAIEFTDDYSEGRQGFYPPSQGIVAASPSPLPDGEVSPDAS